MRRGGAFVLLVLVFTQVVKRLDVLLKLAKHEKGSVVHPLWTGFPRIAAVGFFSDKKDLGVGYHAESAAGIIGGGRNGVDSWH